MTVMPLPTRQITCLLIATALLFVSESALALRCGNRIVKKEMIESEVIALCGEPTSVRNLGFILVPYVVRYRPMSSAAEPCDASTAATTNSSSSLKCCLISGRTG